MARANRREPSVPPPIAAPAPPIAPERLAWWWAAAVAAGIFVVTCVMTAPVPGDGDCGEFTIVLARAALAHPGGYPLYTMLGHAFGVAAHAAGATWAYAAALWSAVGGGLAAFFLFRLADRLCGDGPGLGRFVRFALAATPTVLFFMNPMVSLETTHAEVYAWHLAWACGASLLFVRLFTMLLGREDPGPRRVAWASAWWGLVCGVGLAHHSTSVLVSGPLTLALLGALLVRSPGRCPWIALAALTAVMGLSSYGFVFWKASHADPGDWFTFERSARGAFNHITSKQYQEWVVGGFSPSAVQADFLASWVYPWMFPGLALLAVAAVMARKRRAESLSLLTLLVAALVGVRFTFRLHVNDPSSYFLAPLALGLAAIAPAGAAIARRATPRIARIGAAALLVASLVIGYFWFVTGMSRKAATIDMEGLVRNMWGRIPDEPGIVFWEDDMFHRLRAYQFLAGEKPGLEIWRSDCFQARPIREDFKTRLGIDPLVDVANRPWNPGVWQSVHESVNRQTRLPVYEFIPEYQVVRRLNKPAPGSESR